MKFRLTLSAFITILVVAMLVAWVRPAAAVRPCEVDIESDGGDADDVCVVTTAKSDCNTLQKVIDGAYGNEKWCAIDHNKKYGAFVFFQDPVSGTPSQSNKNKKPGGTTLTQTITLSGKLPSDGADAYGDGSGDPLVLTGDLLQYTLDCFARGCSNPSQGDWEDHLLDGTFGEPPHTADHPAFNIERWGDAEKNKTDWDPVIEVPHGDDRAAITVDLPSADAAGFLAKVFSYVQFRHVTLKLKKGAAFEFDNTPPSSPVEGSVLFPQVSFLDSRIEVGASNPTDHIFRGKGVIWTEGAMLPAGGLGIAAFVLPEVMGGTSPVVISVGKAVSPESPFSIVEADDAAQGIFSVVNMRNSVVFESPSLPEGLSLATWTNSDLISCRVMGMLANGELCCRFDEENPQAIPGKVVFLEEYADPGNVLDATVFTVGSTIDVADGAIAVAPGQPVFAADGRRIEIEMPTCPDGSVAPSSLECTIEHGAFNGFIDGGGFDFSCDAGYKKDETLGVCILECFDGTGLNDAGDACIVPAGHEWNIDNTQVYEECPGQPVPNADGSECVCKDSEKEPVELASGIKCKAICTDPLMFRNDSGNCKCPDGYNKDAGECVEIPAKPPATPPPSSTTPPAQTGSATDTEGDITNTTTCIGFSCFDNAVERGQGGNGSDGVNPSAGFAVGGCSLAPTAGAATGNAWALLLLAASLLALARPTGNGAKQKKH